MKQTNQNRPNMKAIVYTEYGSPDVLQLKEVAMPTPKDNEVRIRIRATAANSGDARLRRADPFGVRLFFGLFKPNRNILGGVFSGEIESVGKDVTLYKVGDEVFGATGMSFGAYGEYKCLPEDGIFSIKPGGLSHTEAAVVPFGGATALHFIRKANIQKGQKVLIIGASGAVGSSAVQLAASFGADVTGVCGPSALDLVKSLGAKKVIDYTREDFTKSNETYDVVYDTVGKNSYASCLQSVSKTGTLLLGASGMNGMIRGLWTTMTSNRRVIAGIISQNASDVSFLKALVEAGKLKPVIDRIYKLAQMAAAHAYVDEGHKKGNVAIEMA
jgi:NADPH:quinone reductase-like Zn-dependent oxidoreductase